MALSTRNVASFSSTTAQTANYSFNNSYTVGSGTQLLAVQVQLGGHVFGSGNVSATVRWADSGGANDEALTLAAVADNFSTANDVRTELWYIVNPTARAGTIEVDVMVQGGADIASTSVTVEEVIGGVNTGSPVGATNTATGNSSSCSLTLTTSFASSLIISSNTSFGGDTDPFTPQSGITAELLDGATGTGTGTDHGFWVGEALTTAAGAYAVGCTSSVSDRFAVAAMEVKEAAAAAAAKHLMLLGVGS